jgi:hypothetical protein
MEIAPDKIAIFLNCDTFKTPSSNVANDTENPTAFRPNVLTITRVMASAKAAGNCVAAAPLPLVSSIPKTPAAESVIPRGVIRR